MDHALVNSAQEATVQRAVGNCCRGVLHLLIPCACVSLVGCGAQPGTPAKTPAASPTTT